MCIWKGIAAAAAYSEPELRTMGDVDELVPAEDMQTARNVLLRAGYEPENGDLHEDAMHWGAEGRRNF